MSGEEMETTKSDSEHAVESTEGSGKEEVDD